MFRLFSVSVCVFLIQCLWCPLLNEDFYFALSLKVLHLDTQRKLNVHKTLRRRPGWMLNVLWMFNLRPVSKGWLLAVIVVNIIFDVSFSMLTILSIVTIWRAGFIYTVTFIFVIVGLGICLFLAIMPFTWLVAHFYSILIEHLW